MIYLLIAVPLLLSVPEPDVIPIPDRIAEIKSALILRGGIQLTRRDRGKTIHIKSECNLDRLFHLTKEDDMAKGKAMKYEGSPADRKADARMQAKLDKKARKGKTRSKGAR